MSVFASRRFHDDPEQDCNGRATNLIIRKIVKITFTRKVTRVIIVQDWKSF